MSFVVVALVYPLLLGVLSTGAGMLVQRLSGLVLPMPLIPAAGFGVLVVVSQFTVLSPATAPLTPEALAVVAITGAAVGRHDLVTRWRSSSRTWWLLPGCAALTYLTVAMPLLAARRNTFPGYLLDTTAGFHLAAGEYMLHHGAPLPPATPAYGAMLNAYYGHGYPSGGQVLMAATGWLSGQDLLWLYFPFQVFALALSALVLAFLAQRAGLPRWAAALSGWIAAVPALVTAYALMGSIKEMTALPLLLLMGAAVVLARHQVGAGLRPLIPFSIAAAGAIGAIGLPALAWVVLLALAMVAQTLPTTSVLRRSAVDALRNWLWIGIVALSSAAVLVIVLALPTVTRLGASLTTAESLSGSNAAFANDPGSLVRPLRFVQALGVWLGGSHRVDPKYLNQTYLLIGVVFVCLALGITWLLRRRAWSLLTWLAASLVAWAALYLRGTEWTDAKVMMLTSPVIVLVAMIGAFGDVTRHRAQGVVLAAVIGASVLGSDALLYHYTNLAPTRYVELRQIGERFAGQGPTLVPDFDEYTFYVLRHLDIDSPGFAGDMRRPFALVGPGPGYGHSYDVDQIQPAFVQPFRLIVMRRSPRWSRPPGNFTLVWSGHFYDVWRRVGPPPRQHIAAGTATQPIAALPCRTLRALGRDATVNGGSLRYAVRPEAIMAKLGSGGVSPDAALGNDLEGLPDVSFGGPGTVVSAVAVPRSRTYRLWIGGDVDRPLHVLIDGRQVAAPSTQSGGDGSMIDLGPVGLTAGHHQISLVRGGGSLNPGDAGSSLIDGIYLEPVGVEHETVTTINPAAWRSLCGRPIDWIEVT